MVAMVLGTALAALGPSARGSEELAPRAVQDITRYCSACWRNARLPLDCWNDCTQDVFQRLLERVPTGRWEQVMAPDGAERQEFLRAIDTVKKRVQRDRQRWSGLHHEAPDHRAPQDQERADSRANLRHAAEQALSGRQQRIVERTCEGWSVAEIAADLGVAAARISDEKYKAIHKLRSYFGVDETTA
jgi:RNA polymerase sigma factor (sigma-70 family)